MKRWAGRGVGVLVGIPAGVPGILFGFLIGGLVDQFLRDSGVERAYERYLRRPEGERNEGRALLYGTASLAATILVHDGEGDAGRITAFCERPWPGADSGLSRAWRRRLLERGIGQFPPLRWEAIVEDLERRWSASDSRPSRETAVQLVDLLTALAGEGAAGLTPTDRRLVEAVARAVGVELSRVGGLDQGACRLLGVETSASREQVRHAFHALATQMHPDTAGQLESYQQAELHEAFLRISQAYDELQRQLDAREAPAPRTAEKGPVG